MSNPASQPATIDVELRYFPLAFILSFFKPQFSIDGGPPQVGQWGHNLVTVAPGQHSVSAWCPYMFLKTMGQASTQVGLNPGDVLRVTWKAPWLVFLNGTISVSTGQLPAGATASALPAGAVATGAAMGGAWHPDPSGRYEQRYWDGAGWTSHVSRGGVASEDPL